ncbi:MAG: 2-oxoacid:ferredoxin oxidoreductase subunit beta [Gammaproteobacteria bacterium]|uniref:2-oxoacid:ferredoxin oxidoreductase subunit beta n=1 Tax=Pseudomaricurvus alcaniphilus TaxID=1166482 RepID=UPI00140917FC|nr:2-oxoacid:ferredoxin oxidoreductase subunit beta [Pseudomaricurvus alcaniphilus]MBR9910726.1 2-oxoacid:ferredoxin oxidoreductase subunit beta [Gammaproteobacteria bacterium]NHN39065.1 2-oxoacid:ferredoxin oxidoreductase subunit beta [Pseudomaricurvus alcaniphilus]
MSYIITNFRHPLSPTNKLGFTRKDYEGALSTLCAGCGHDSISSAIISACFEMSIEPHRVAKLSGIGCSSKTPTYFLGNSHGFNSVHGRMPSITTGANLANRDLTYIGVSGDGDSASIGLGQFAHVARRNLNMLYIVENNGCYGLTKGQNSATTDLDSVNKSGVSNTFEPIDLANLALQLGATFVARSFSGDKQQLVPLMKAAMSHRGFAFIDVISPCVTFNNNPGSKKSYDFVREHQEATSSIDFVPMEKEITTQYDPGTTQEVTLHDGSVIHLHKAIEGFNVHDRRSALRAIKDHQERGEVLTGLLYVDTDPVDLHDVINTTHKPLSSLTESSLCPGSGMLKSINDSLR